MLSLIVSFVLSNFPPVYNLLQFRYLCLEFAFQDYRLLSILFDELVCVLVNIFLFKLIQFTITQLILENMYFIIKSTLSEF